MTNYDIDSLVKRIDSSISKKVLTEAVDTDKIHFRVYMYYDNGRSYDSGRQPLRVDNTDPNFIGHIGLPNFDAMLLSLDQSERNQLKLAKPLRDGEILVRYESHRSREGGFRPVIKINTYTGKVFFFDHETDPLEVLEIVNFQYVNIYASALK